MPAAMHATSAAAAIAAAAAAAAAATPTAVRAPVAASCDHWDISHSSTICAVRALAASARAVAAAATARAARTASRSVRRHHAVVRYSRCTAEQSGALASACCFKFVVPLVQVMCET